MNPPPRRPLAGPALDSELLDRARPAASTDAHRDLDGITVEVAIHPAEPSAALELRRRQRDALVRLLRQAVEANRLA